MMHACSRSCVRTVALDVAQGKSDGTFAKKRYFTCEELHAIFITLDKVGRDVAQQCVHAGKRSVVRSTDCCSG